ncbi:MAG: hypothetical protein PVS2B2_02230 [Candidatus Acidiferrum sp.]
MRKTGAEVCVAFADDVVIFRAPNREEMRYTPVVFAPFAFALGKRVANTGVGVYGKRKSA